MIGYRIGIVMHRFLSRSFLLSSRIPHYCRSSSSDTTKGEQSSESYIWVKDYDINDKLKKLVPYYDFKWSHEETFSFNSFKLSGPKEEIKRVAVELEKCFKDGCIQLFPCRSPFEKPANTTPRYIDVTLTFNEYLLDGSWISIGTTNFSTLASKISKRNEFQCIGFPNVNIIVKEHVPLLYGPVKSYSSPNRQSSSSDFKPVINVSVTHDICDGRTEVGYIVKQVIQDMFSNHFVTIDSVSSPITAVCSRDCNNTE